MTQFKLLDKTNDNESDPIDTRAKAEERKAQMEDMGIDVESVEVGSAEEIDERTPDDVEVIEMDEHEDYEQDEEKMQEGYEKRAEESESVPDVQGTEDALDQLGESLETDPLSILPGHMIDQIQGKPAINKRGYAMIAERYGVEVKAEMVSFPWENEEGRAVAKAVAKTESGKEYQDYATASAQDGDMEDQLIELASTRSLKRVTGWATGLGIVSYQELSNQLEGEL